MSKNSRFRGCFDKQYGKRAQTLLKYTSQTLYHIHWSLARKLCSKKSLLLTYQFLGLLVDTVAANEMYLVDHRGNLTIPIQILFAKKQKTFSAFFAGFWKSRLRFKHFE